MFWAILEMLRNEATYKLPLDKTTYRAIKMHTGTTIDVEAYLKDCISEYTDGESGNGLFNSDKKFFWSASLLRRMEKYETLKEKRSQAANARWNKERKKESKSNAKKKQKQWILLLIICLVLFMDYLLGTISMVDYNAAGILTVLLFYFFRKKTWVSFVAQFAGMYYLNVVMLGDLYYPVTILGHHFEIPQQSFALLALIPIWLYNREQGYHSKWFKYFCYAFYPAHLLILFIIWQWRIR